MACLRQLEGYLEDVEVNQVLDFEHSLLAYMHSEKAEFMATINETGAYNDEIVARCGRRSKPSRQTQA